jgi:hypothetical protein
MIFAAGVTAGINGAPRVAAELRGDEGRASHPALHAICTGAPLPVAGRPRPRRLPSLRARAVLSMRSRSSGGDSATGGCAPRHHRCCIKIDRT